MIFWINLCTIRFGVSVLKVAHSRKMELFTMFYFMIILIYLISLHFLKYELITKLHNEKN